MPYVGPNGVETVLPPPAGYVVNLEHPQRSKVTEHYIVCSIGMFLALLALAQRLYTKIFLLKGLHLDDAFILLAWATSVGTQGLTLWLAITGTGMIHGWELTMSGYATFRLGLYTSAPVYALCNGFTKLSLLTFYLQLSPQPWFRHLVWISIAFVSIYTIVSSAMMMFPCAPIRKAWDIYVPADEGSCIQLPPLYVVTAVSNIVTDLICFLLPLKMISGLHMKRQLKIGTMVVFLIASMTIVTSIVRCFYLFPMLSSKDISWDTGSPSVWVCVEANLFIICGCMPTLSKFLGQFGLNIIGTTSAGNSGQPRIGDYQGERSGGSKGSGYLLKRVKRDHVSSISGRDRYHRFGDSDDTTVARTRERSRSRSCERGTIVHHNTQVIHSNRNTHDSNAAVELRCVNDVTGQRKDDLDQVLGVVTHEVSIGSSNLADDRSDKAIIQSKTFTIKYEENERRD